MDKLLTISVAAYNVEQYLEKLLRSIIESDALDAIEILIVNDGSKDGTARIAGEYQEKYPGSIRLIDKENGGHGSTINRGIVEAKGKFFRALDGDDWVHSGHLAKLIEKLPSIDADIILSDFCNCYEDGRQEIRSEFQGLTDGAACSFDEIAGNVAWMRYHTVIYRTDILKQNHVRLDEHCFYVDREFMLYPIPYVNTIYYFRDYIYCYRLGLTDQSVSPESRMKHIDNGLTVANSIIAFLNESGQGLSAPKAKYVVDGIVEHCIWHFNSLLLFPASGINQNDIRQFDLGIKRNAPAVYKAMSDRNKKLLFLRLTGYHGYWFIHWFAGRKRKA